MTPLEMKKWLARRSHPFGITSSKFDFKAGESTAGLDSRPERIREVAHASLKRLKTDRI